MATLLKERSTYWVRTNSSSRRSDFDYRAYWKIYYEQSEADKKLLRTKITVDYYLQTYWDGDSLSIYDSTSSNVYINGSSIGTISMNTSSYDEGTKLVKKGSKTTYVYHNKDGTGSFTFRGTGFDLGTSTTTYDLPKINVGTEIINNSSSSNYINLDSEVTFTLKPLTGQVEANKLYYKINNTEYVISESTTETTVKYSFPVDIIANFPNNANISLTIYCKNLVSNVETTTTVYLKLPDSYVPSASLAIADVMENKPSVLNGLWIKNQSKLKGTITADGVKGSTIKSYLSSISGFSQQYNTNPFTTQALTVAGKRIVTSKVTDTRERSVEVTQEINVIDYNKPSFVSLNVKRCLQDGTLSENGTYAKIICKYSISPINNLNSKSLNVKLNGGTAVNIPLNAYSGEVSSVAFSNIDQANSYTITAILTDLFGDVKQDFLLGIAYKTVSKRAGGKGITFGQVATEDGFHNYMPSTFYKGVVFESGLNGVEIARYMKNLYIGNNKDLNDYKKAGHYGIYGVNTNSPTSAISILEVFEYSGDWIIQRVTEVSQNYKSWIRVYHSGSTWTSWQETTFKPETSKLMAVFTGTTTISSTSHVKLSLTEKVRNGSLLSISNGGIRIGAGVTKIEVSGNVYFTVGMNEGDSIRSFIYKNDEAIVHNYNRSNGTYEDRPISSFLVDVTEGDIIYLYGSNATAGRGVIESNSYLTVKVIG